MTCCQAGHARRRRRAEIRGARRHAVRHALLARRKRLQCSGSAATVPRAPRSTAALASIATNTSTVTVDDSNVPSGGPSSAETRIPEMDSFRAAAFPAAAGHVRVRDAKSTRGAWRVGFPNGVAPVDGRCYQPRRDAVPSFRARTNADEYGRVEVTIDID